MSATVKSRILKWSSAPDQDSSGKETETVTKTESKSKTVTSSMKGDSSSGGDQSKSRIQWSSSKGRQSNGTLNSSGESSPERAKDRIWGRSVREGLGSPDSSPDRSKTVTKVVEKSTARYGSGHGSDADFSTPVRPDRTSKQRESSSASSKTERFVHNGRVEREERKTINGKDIVEESTDSGVGWESPVQATDDRIDEWIRGTHTTVPMETSIRHLITNYSNRSHLYPSPGMGMLPFPVEQAELEAQEYLNDRIVEKKQLGHLNNRFANYIEHVKNLESENISLLAELRTYQEKYTNMTLHLKMKYQTEITECREMGDDRQREINALKAHQKELLEDLEQWRKKYV